MRRNPKKKEQQQQIQLDSIVANNCFDGRENSFSLMNNSNSEKALAATEKKVCRDDYVHGINK